MSRQDEAVGAFKEVRIQLTDHECAVCENKWFQLEAIDTSFDDDPIEASVACCGCGTTLEIQPEEAE